MAAVIRAVLFDLDDTLVDHQSAAARAVQHWAHEMGLPDPPTVLAERWAVVSNRHYSAYQRRELTVGEQQRARVRDFLPHLDLRTDEDAQAAFDTYLVRYRSAWTAFAEAPGALARVRAAGLGVGVLTNGEDDFQRAKLEHTGLAAAVDVVMASSTLPWSKPDPRAFRAACAALGAAPGETLMVGDNLTVDVLGARAAGLPALLLDRDGRHRDADLAGGVRIGTLAALARHLGRPRG